MNLGSQKGVYDMEASIGRVRIEDRRRHRQSWCLYRGDLIEALDQISVKTGQGAMAAMRVHDWLREQNGHDQK
ncbi:hypothetical protein [Sphingomonas koreensis]|uniref:hypothetical protein n=1 Tax=Sphingomonas koreensis TaxID=93064 RepID=UPI0013DE29AE|nr:hypothetical protein [Sphingomonas koreensis]MDC7808726.1 hypothetical protein [Sphingomonas koreensis]